MTFMTQMKCTTWKWKDLSSKIYHMDEITHLKMNFVNEIINGIDNMDDESYWMMKTHNIHEIIVIYEKWPSSIWLNIDGHWHYEVHFINEPTFIDVIKVSSMWLTIYGFSIPKMWYDPLMSSTCSYVIPYGQGFHIGKMFSILPNFIYLFQFHPQYDCHPILSISTMLSRLYTQRLNVMACNVHHSKMEVTYINNDVL